MQARLDQASDTNATILGAACAGDTSAWDELVRRYRGAVRSAVGFLPTQTRRYRRRDTEHLAPPLRTRRNNPESRNAIQDDHQGAGGHQS